MVAIFNALELLEGCKTEPIPVKQNAQIILYNIETNSILAVIEDTNESEQTKTLILASEYSNTAIFKAEIADMSVDDEENLYFGQNLKITSFAENLSLAIGQSQGEKGELNPAPSYTRITSEFPKITQRRTLTDPTKQYYLPLLTNDSKDIKLIKYSTLEKEKQGHQTILNGDYVRIRCFDSWMTFYPTQEKKKDIFFENMTDRFQEYNYLHTIFQIIDDKSLEKDPVIASGSKNYVLKHFLTGNYIHFDSPDQLKAFEHISNTESESCYLNFDGVNENTIITEKLPLKLKYKNKQGLEAFSKPSAPVALKNIQFEMNTLYFFGFRIPEDYCYKNQKNLVRSLTGTTSDSSSFSNNIVLEKVQKDEMETIREIEQFANQIQVLIDTLSVPHQTTNIIEKMNSRLKKLIEGSQHILERMKKRGKVVAEEDFKDLVIIKYSLDVPDRYIQTLIREFRIFDLIHILNFLFIKKSPHFLADDASLAEFNVELFFELYEKFSEVILISLTECPSNRFYNSQFIRIYIHFISDGCDGVFKQNSSQNLLHKMRYVTLRLLKKLLWDEDLDGLGQLNFYQTVIFTSIKNNKTFHTYYLELVEHISSSKAYNLINTFRDSFITQILSVSDQFKSIYPIILEKEPNQPLVVKFERDETVELSLSTLPENPEAYNYFIKAFKSIVALSTSRSLMFYHQFIKHYPYRILQRVLQDPEINVEIKMLIHTVVLCVFFEYLKLPFSFIPPNIQTSDDLFRQILNQEEKKIVEFCKTCISGIEKELLVIEGIEEEVTKNMSELNTQDSSQQIQLLENFLVTEPTLESAQIALFYIESVFKHSPTTIHFLNKVKEALIKIRALHQNFTTAGYRLLPYLLEVFEVLNKKMQEYSTLQLHNQVIKTKNAEAESILRKIIGGLKKTHFENFAPISMISLNEPVITSRALNYLKEVAVYEDNIANELNKIIILSSQSSVENIKEVIDIVLTLNQNIRKYVVQREIENNTVELEGQEYVNTIELLEKLFSFIYDPNKHFLFNNKDILTELHIPDINNPTKRFFRTLQKEKVNYRDQPFLLKPEAISKLHQRLFTLISVHEILLKLLNCVVIVTLVDKPQDAPAEPYLTRLIILILIAFVYKNKNNQNLLSRSHGFVSLYYQQKYIDRSCDTLSLFAEVMRDNDDLLEISKKFIYDITCYTFLGTINPRAINKESGAYLATAIMSMHYLHKADLPALTYDTFEVALKKFADILNNEFPNLDVLKKIQEKAEATEVDIETPACYYNIRQMLVTMIEVIGIAYKEDKKDKVENFRIVFDCKKLLKGLLKSEFRFQFEIKSLYLRCIQKINFSKIDVHDKFLSTENADVTKDLFAYVLNELYEFLLFVPGELNKEKIFSSFEAFCQATDPMDENGEKDKGLLREVRQSYEELNNFGLSKIRQLIFMNELPISVSWEYLYIYDECWAFLAKLCANYPEVISSTELFEHFLKMTEFLIERTNQTNFKALKSVRKSFIIMEEIKVYEPFKEMITEIKKSLVSKQENLQQEQEIKATKNFDKKMEDPLERKILDSIISNMKSSKRKDIALNIKTFAEHITLDANKINILSELKTVIESNPVYLPKDTNILVTKLMRAFVQQAFTDEQSVGFNTHGKIHQMQQDLQTIQADKSFVEGFRTSKDPENIKELFCLVLEYAKEGDYSVITNLSKHLWKGRDKLLWSNSGSKIYESSIEFFLEEILKIPGIQEDEEISKLLQYCLQSHQEIISQSQKSLEFNELTEMDRNNLFRQKIHLIVQEYIDKDLNGSYEVLGPLPINLNNFGDIFILHEEDVAALKIIKKTMLAKIKEANFEIRMIDHFQNKFNVKKDDLHLVKTYGILLLDVFISKIRHGIVSLNDV